ncbi:hypothetical protein BJ165DRAFT_1410662 [Panaeolus papilionaceus]|nr:hypothetical protein BJ165DRAFT_1410662 [Panaeolus papilionaceus]
MNVTLPPHVSVSVPTGAGVSPIDWDQLKFHPIGLFDLCHLQGYFSRTPNIFQKYGFRFLASDIAWFAAVCHKDYNHHHTEDMFHEAYHQFVSQGSKPDRKTTLENMQDLLFDLATLWDRVAGGTTSIMHVNGTMVPGSPHSPEYIKADVYLPPALVHHHPLLHCYFLDTVQHFIETIGVVTVKSWVNHAKKNLGWSLTQLGNPKSNPPMAAIPAPVAGTSHYIFHGQPPKTGSDTEGAQVAQELSRTIHKLQEAKTANAILQAQTKSAALRIQELEGQVNHLKNSVVILSTQPPQSPTTPLHIHRTPRSQRDLSTLETPSRSCTKSSVVSVAGKSAQPSPWMLLSPSSTPLVLTSKRASVLCSPDSVTTSATTATLSSSTLSTLLVNISDIFQDGVASDRSDGPSLWRVFLETHDLSKWDVIIHLILANVHGVDAQRVELQNIGIRDSVVTKLFHVHELESV